jgi:hypothetical protein
MDSYLKLLPMNQVWVGRAAVAFRFLFDDGAGPEARVLWLVARFPPGRSITGGLGELLCTGISPTKCSQRQIRWPFCNTALRFKVSRHCLVATQLQARPMP